MALEWLKSYNPHYQTITIDPQNIDEAINIHFVEQSQTKSSDASASNTESVAKRSLTAATYHYMNPDEKAEDVEEVEDPLSEFRNVSSETCLQPYLPDYPVMAHCQHLLLKVTLLLSTQWKTVEV